MKVKYHVISSVCKACKEDLPLLRNGYCADCDQAIREDIADGKRDDAKIEKKENADVGRLDEDENSGGGWK